ncbi:amino acid permease domain protein [Mycobacterium ulcerans str. Harvey]|uniref:Amino acid permease domain protein n=1 Tax=Mycobacterium ulcerans str. Harvey TaxID=1299332 RepID=A0ABP3APX9_MYCUL|nr:amino acid permease domain protein [Mycobacterium ulcerans str. Harvey]
MTFQLLILAFFVALTIGYLVGDSRSLLSLTRSPATEGLRRSPRERRWPPTHFWVSTLSAR